jgi:Flp pilus assembly protein TadG
MTADTRWTHVTKRLKRAVRGAALFIATAGQATGGGVAVQFAFASIPISFLVLAAVDMQQGQTLRAKLQDALDAATLAVGRSGVTTNDQAQALGANVLAANFKPTGVTVKDMTAQFTLSGSKVLGNASVSIKAIESNPLESTVPFRQGSMKVQATSEVQRNMFKLEVAMVLDNTGSMAGTKLSLLKTAANNFVDTLETAASQSIDPDIVKISLVPFSQTVNVGATYRTAGWMDQNGASPINDGIFYATTVGSNSHANRFTLFKNMGVSWGGCVESRQAPYDVQDTGPDVTVPATLFTPYFAPDEPTYDGQTASLSGFYNSYLTNDGTTSTTWYIRQGNIAKYSHAPDKTGVNQMGYKYGPNAGCELTSLVRLTNNGAAVKSGINAMTAVGDTNIPMGLAWGWHSLSPSGPFADGQAYGTKNLQKVVVLMTDGQNQNTVAGNGNASYYSGLGYIWQARISGVGASSTSTQRQTALDGRLSLLCSNMKAKGVIIYTVRVDVHDANYGVLKNCASSPSMFYDVSDASQLDQVFKSIAGAIQNLRLTR